MKIPLDAETLVQQSQKRQRNCEIERRILKKTNSKSISTFMVIFFSL